MQTHLNNNNNNNSNNNNKLQREPNKQTDNKQERRRWYNRGGYCAIFPIVHVAAVSSLSLLRSVGVGVAAARVKDGFAVSGVYLKIHKSFRKAVS